MTYHFFYLEHHQIMRFRVVGAPRQQIEDYFLRHSSLRVSLDPQGQRVRLKDRYLVDRHNDVLDGGRLKPLQDNPRIVAHQNREGLDKNPILPLRLA